MEVPKPHPDQGAGKRQGIQAKKSASQSVSSYWFVGASWGGSDDQTSRFLKQGVWENGYEDRYLDEVRAMQPGERIAIKSTFTRKHDLPFPNFDHVISVMRIKATGVIVENPGDGRTLRVDWKPTEPRDWYFYTGRSTVWRVRPESDEALALIAFTFEDTPQDYRWWSERPYWRERLSRPTGEFGWTSFYEALAYALRDWQSRRGELAEVVHGAVAEAGLSPLCDEFADGSKGPLLDIDPFTFFGVFNRRITDERRTLIATRLASALEISVPAPTSFPGIPCLNPQKSWFFHYQRERDPLAIDRLWDMFNSALGHAASNDEQSYVEFIDAYDAAQRDKGVRYNLSIGLFWISPWRFPSFDAHTRRAIVEALSLAEFRAPPNGQAYLDIADRLLWKPIVIPKLVRDAWRGDASRQTSAEDDTGGEDEAVEEDGGVTQDDRYRTQADDPALIDALERGPFAAVLAARICEIRKSQNEARQDRHIAEIRERRHGEEDQAFMVHIHGPWGSGKSSLLNLLEQKLDRGDGASDPPQEPSLVVWFNAWKYQRMRPPWWALLSEIYQTAVKSYGVGSRAGRHRERRALKRLWWWWRLRADWGPLLIVAAAIAVILGFALFGGTLQVALTAGAGIIGAAAAIYTYARPALFGSAKAAQTYADLTTDPYGPMVKLFHDLVKRIDEPLVVFIDDLDRCESGYVVELLEGIQTMFRGAPVTYVVAADRKWICSGFDKKYSEFAATIGEPCRPLGYLFLDKLFQVSAEMPQLPKELKASYLAALLRTATPGALPDAGVAKAAIEKMKDVRDEAGVARVLEEEAAPNEGESEEQRYERERALRAAAAVRISGAAVAEMTTHRLEKFSDLLEPNPRAMKRLVNAVGMAQARGILEGRTAAPETRARWALLSLRWPLLADFFAEHPKAIDHWRMPAEGESAEPPPSAWPEHITRLHGHGGVMAVVGSAGDEGALTSESLAAMLA